jgi:hypothetical protein
VALLDGALINRELRAGDSYRPLLERGAWRSEKKAVIFLRISDFKFARRFVGAN